MLSGGVLLAVLVVDHAFASGDGDSADNVTGAVDGGVRDVDDFIDASNHTHDVDGETHGGEQHDGHYDTAARDAGRADGDKRRENDDGDLLCERQGHAVDLSREDDSRGVVCAAGVHVDGCTKGKREAVELFFDLEVIARDAHGDGQRAGGAGGRRGHGPQRQDLAHKIRELDLAHELQDQEVHDKDDDGAVEIVAEDELAKGPKDLCAVLANRTGHQGADAERGGLHDDGGHFVHDIRGLNDEILDDRDFGAQHDHSAAEDRTEDDDAHHVGVGHCIDDVIRNHGQQRVGNAVHCGGFIGADCGGIDLETDTGIDQVCNAKADETSQQCGDDVHAKDLRAHALEFIDVREVGNAADDGEEYQGNRQHLDELEEDIADDLNDKDLFAEDNAEQNT